MTDSCDKMEEQTEIIITSETEGKRLDAVLAEKTDGLSRSFLQKLFEEGKVFRNGKLCSKKEKGVEGRLYSGLDPGLQRSWRWKRRIFPLRSFMRTMICWWSTNRLEWWCIRPRELYGDAGERSDVSLR